MKNPLTSKSVWLGIATALAGLIVETTKILPEEVASKLLIVSGALYTIVRFFTIQPIGFGGKNE